MYLFPHVQIHFVQSAWSILPWFLMMLYIWAFLKAQWWRRQWHPTPVLLPGKSHGRRSLVGCSPWGRRESNTTERLHFHFSLSCIGEGNGNPLQCSCLENPRDGRAWWAAVNGSHRVGHDWRVPYSDKIQFEEICICHCELESFPVLRRFFCWGAQWY